MSIKPSVDAHIKKELFTKDTHLEYIDFIKNIWDYKKNTKLSPLKLDKFLGKTYTSIIDPYLPNKFLDPVTEYAKSINPKVEFVFLSVVRYSKDHGTPQLPPHFDAPSNLCFIIDYQIESNLTWPICVDGEVFPLEDNSCLVFDSIRTIHWRVPQTFNDGEYVYMAFYHYAEESINLPAPEAQAYKLEKYFKVYLDQLGKENFSDSHKLLIQQFNDKEMLEFLDLNRDNMVQ